MGELRSARSVTKQLFSDTKGSSKGIKGGVTSGKFFPKNMKKLELNEAEKLRVQEYFKKKKRADEASIIERSQKSSAKKKAFRSTRANMKMKGGSHQEFKISGVNFEKFGSSKNNISIKKMPSERLTITKTRMKSMDSRKLSDYRLKSSRN